MKVKVFIVTYNNNKALNDCLQSLYLSDLMIHQYHIFVINNFEIIGVQKSSNQFNLSILNNVLRPDRSTGHLARNWNEALVNGFGNLKDPECDVVIAMQNDTVVLPDFMSTLEELHKTFSFVQRGAGDNFMSWTPEGVKKIGLFDERFCNIGFQEADYFMRAMMYNKEGSSLNDVKHGRIWNYDGESPLIDITFSQAEGNKEFHNQSGRYHEISKRVLGMKWGGLNFCNWNQESIKQFDKNVPGTPSFMFYPYFEEGINPETLRLQRFI